MYRAVLLAAVAAAAGLTARAAPPMRPNGPPPELLTVKVNRDGNLESVRTQMVYRQEARAEKRVVDGREVVVTVMVNVPTHVSYAIRHAAKDVKAFDLDGLPIDASKLPKLLEKETTVIVSPDGQPPDAFYRQFFKEGTLMLVLPTRATPSEVPPAFRTPRRDGGAP